MTRRASLETGRSSEKDRVARCFEVSYEVPVDLNDFSPETSSALWILS